MDRKLLESLINALIDELAEQNWMESRPSFDELIQSAAKGLGLVALEMCEDVEDDITVGSLLCCSNAVCGKWNRSIVHRESELTECEVKFLRECLAAVAS